MTGKAWRGKEINQKLPNLVSRVHSAIIESQTLFWSRTWSPGLCQGTLPHTSNPSWSQRLFWSKYFQTFVIISLWQGLSQSRMSLERKEEQSTFTPVTRQSIRCFCTWEMCVCVCSTSTWGCTFGHRAMHFGWQGWKKFLSPIQGTGVLQNPATICFSISLPL